MKGRLVALAAVLLLPTVAADLNHRTTFEGGAIPYDGVATIPIMIEVGCDIVLASGGGFAGVQVTGLPTWLTASSTTVAFETRECLANPAGNVTKQANLTLVPSMDAPGFVNASLNATIVYDGEAPGPLGEVRVSPVALPDVHVSYRPGHVLAPAGDQTFAVTGSSYSFDIKVDITANARTMIMFEDKRVQGGGMLTGLQAHVFDVPAGERSLVQPIKFTAPLGAWDTVRVMFYNYSHCLDGMDCGPQVESNVTWTFKNANATMGAPSENSESKGTPGPLLPATLVSIAFVAILARRKA